MPWECVCFDFALIQHVALLCFQWPLAQLFPAVFASAQSTFFRCLCIYYCFCQSLFTIKVQKMKASYYKAEDVMAVL